MWKRWRFGKPDLNDTLALVGLPVAGFALWQITPVAFWGFVALCGVAAAGWGVYRAGVR